MWNNSLNEGSLRIGDHAVDLTRITVPLLHVIVEHDSLVPWHPAGTGWRAVAPGDTGIVLDDRVGDYCGWRASGFGALTAVGPPR